jgi:hypothetical protein
MSLYILDTDHLSLHQAGFEPLRAHFLKIPPVNRTLEFLCNFTALKFDVHAEAYFQTLREQKIRIGTQDLKIAAIALSQGAVVVTRNERDFGKIPGLKVEDWTRGVG